jgi:outer membrane biosynthesis protein TonB
LSRSWSCIRATTALAAVAIIVAGCAATNNAASSQGEQPYKTAYGLSSEGTTTDLYTELFGSRKPPAAPATATAAAQPVQPVTASTATQPVQPVTAPAATQPAQPATTTAATRQNKPAMASAARQVQPAPVATEVAQQPAPPEAPPEPDVPTAYGITANGPTTDLYTALFGPRRRDGP